VAGDPRLEEARIERVGGVVLVGVLHDHPASTYRVQTVVDAADPDVLALELPPLAVPLAVHHAADEHTPPMFGGEMSAAVQAGDTDRVVGIDGPSAGFLRYLAAELYAKRAAPATVRRTVEALQSVVATTLVRRLAAVVVALTAVELAVEPPTTFDTDRTDDPARQADEERRRVETAQSMLKAFTSPPEAAIRRAARERYMADRLAALDADDAVAVVGQAHLNAVADSLRDAA
jgi:pheromone shutdown protein TraB